MDIMKKDNTCRHQDRSSCLRRCQKEKPFLRGYQKKSVGKLWTEEGL